MLTTSKKLYQPPWLISEEDSIAQMACSEMESCSAVLLPGWTELHFTFPALGRISPQLQTSLLASPMRSPVGGQSWLAIVSHFSLHVGHGQAEPQSDIKSHWAKREFNGGCLNHTVSFYIPNSKPHFYMPNHTSLSLFKLLSLLVIGPLQLLFQNTPCSLDKALAGKI